MKYQIISPEKLESELKENNEIILVDVRTREEYGEKHIPNSILIPLNNINIDELDKIEDIKNKNKKIVIYCKSGNRSKIAGEELANIGYNNIYLLEGGINNWNYEIE